MRIFLYHLDGAEKFFKLNCVVVVVIVVVVVRHKTVALGVETHSFSDRFTSTSHFAFFPPTSAYFELIATLHFILKGPSSVLLIPVPTLM